MSALPEGRIIETVQTKCIIFGEALKIRGQKHKQNLSKNCLKSSMAITVCQFSKIYGGTYAHEPA